MRDPIPSTVSLLENDIIIHTSIGRNKFDELQLGKGFINRQFSYHEGEITQKHIEKNMLKSSPTTTLVSKIVLSDGSTLSYEYDAVERITSVVDKHFVNGEVIETKYEYTYDSLGQLLTETVNGVAVNTMTYDNYGNIQTKNGVEYTYGDENWKDLLTGCGDQTITYDKQGNPTNYLGHTLTWEKGRQLKKFVKADETEIEYTYNANGIRTGKKVDGVLHTYTLDGTKILREIWGNNTLIPLYDNEDGVCGILYNNVPYYFIKNLQGDVIAIVDKEAKTVARYSYDAWGVCTVTQDSSNCQIATINPYRYRGYYFDEEIGMYYLQSRYYDSELGRWINADEATYLGASGTNLGFNLFVYCENNPVTNIDPDGHLVITTTMLICAGIGALVLGTIGGIGGYHLSKKWKVPKGKRWKYVLGGVVIGAVVGALIGGAVGYLIGPSARSGIVLWSGNGNASVFQAAKSFAKKNGLRVLEKTRKGKILTKMQNKLIKEQGKDAAWKIMKPLFDAASEQFARSANGTVHIFLNASGIRFESTFLTVEYWILREMGINMVFHFID